MPEQMIRIPGSIAAAVAENTDRSSSSRRTETFGEFAVGRRRRRRLLLTDRDMNEQADDKACSSSGGSHVLGLAAAELIVNKARLNSFQMEIAKRLNGIIAQLLPFLSQEVREEINSYRMNFN